MKSNRNILITLKLYRRYTKERTINRNQTKTSKSHNNWFKRKGNKSKHKYSISLECNLSNKTQISDHEDSSYRKTLKQRHTLLDTNKRSSTYTRIQFRMITIYYEVNKNNTISLFYYNLRSQKKRNKNLRYKTNDYEYI